MERQAAIDLILDHYENPRHYGTLAAPTFTGQGVNPGCGDVVRLSVRLDDAGRVADIAFEGQGCTISIAAASLLTEMVLGRTLDEALALDVSALSGALGEGLVTGRLACVSLGLRVLYEGSERYRNGG